MQMGGKVSRIPSQTVNHRNRGVGLVEISVVESAQVTEVSVPTSPGTESTKKRSSLSCLYSKIALTVPEMPKSMPELAGVFGAESSGSVYPSSLPTVVARALRTADVVTHHDMAARTSQDQEWAQATPSQLNNTPYVSLSEPVTQPTDPLYPYLQYEERMIELGICMSGCEVHRRGSAYFASFLATELESTSDASPEPEEPADDTYHSDINRTKAEDRVDDVIVVLSNVETVEEGDAIVAEEGGILALAEVIEDGVAVIDKTQSRVVDLIVSTLRLSNLDIVASYVFRGGNKAPMPAAESVGNDVLGPAISDSQKLLRKDGLREVVQNFSAAAAASKLFEQEIRELMSKQTWWYRVESGLLRRADADLNNFNWIY
ncbi:hypothetical protein Tco_0359523 [Tanacetum coccineum]